jgi:hypothetical protein
MRLALLGFRFQPLGLSERMAYAQPQNHPSAIPY